MRSGFGPVNIQAESRARYIAAIRAFQEQDEPYPFVVLFCTNLAERLGKVLGLLSKGTGPVADPGVSDIDNYLESEEEIPKYHVDTLESAILALLLVLAVLFLCFPVWRWSSSATLHARR